MWLVQGQLERLDSSIPRLEHATVLVLASASPRRRELLGWLVAGWVIVVAEIDERPAPEEAAGDLVVEIDGDILGKPTDAAEASAMLGRLAGREHRVSTGFALLAPGGALSAAEVVVTRVRFRPLAAGAIAAYVASGEPEGKAGGYAIQGRGAALIECIDGSLTNVIGLPLVEVGRALEAAGLRDG